MARVMLVSMEGQVGGAERSLLLLLRHLRDRHELSVACARVGPLVQRVRAMGILCHELPGRGGVAHRSVAGLLHLARVAAALVGAAARWRPEVVHANNAQAALACVMAGRCSGARVIWHARDMTGSAALVRVLARGSDRIISVSQATRAHLLARGVDPAKVDVIHNGVAIEGQGCAGTRAGDMLPCRTFASVGQFVPWKRQHLFLLAAARVAGQVPDARFAVIGDDLFGRGGQYGRFLRQRARGLGLEGRVVFPGWLNGMDRAWADIDCLVHAADHEPFGRVIIEAMHAGVPVIAVDGGGPGEIIQDGVTGLLVRAGDPEALSGAMVRLAQDAALAGALARAARQRVLEQFTAERVAQRVDQVYRELLCGGRGRR